jgi:3-oxoacyl-[acyl-carrier-protein] synthase-3
MEAAILGIESYLPGTPVTNADLAADFAEWDIDRIAKKTGIYQRHIATADQCASDLAYMAAQKLFSSGVCLQGEVDYVLLCTQSPDYLLPTTACLLQERLGLPTQIGALDFNLGCSGYIYGLGLAQGLISTGQASRVLLLTGETYSKHIEPSDRGSATIFGDGGTATLIGAVQHNVEQHTATYVYGTDGRGAEHLIVRSGGMRARCSNATPKDSDLRPGFLWMNGPEVFHFAIKVVPTCVRELLQKAAKQIEDIDLFVFHQANRYMLDHLRTKLKIPEEKFFVSLASSGNTVSGTIPMALESAQAQGRLKPGQTVVLVGFGVGLSWGATLLSWPFLGMRSGDS